MTNYAYEHQKPIHAMACHNSHPVNENQKTLALPGVHADRPSSSVHCTKRNLDKVNPKIQLHP